MDYITIDNRTQLQAYLKKFKAKGHHVIALDIEAESNLHVYGEKLCLVQIYDGVNSAIIDPFNIDTDTLKLLFENSKILKVMFDAGSDLSLLKNACDIEIRSILDLGPAVKLLNYDKKDLHSVIALELGIVLEKKRKYQQHNWTKRPVVRQAIDYAITDVKYLLALKDIILAKLYSRKLLEPFVLENLQIQNKDYTRDPEDKYKKISGYSRMNSHEKVLFRKVFDIRDKYAKLCNMPPHNVIHKADLINTVMNPEIIDEIRSAKKISPEMIRDMRRELKKAVKA